VFLSYLERKRESYSTEFQSQSVIGSIFRRSSTKDQEKYFTELSVQVTELSQSLAMVYI